MKSLLIKLLEMRIAEHTKWRLMSIGLCLFAVGVIIYDVYAVLHPSPKNQPLFLLPFEAVAFAVICEVARRHGLQPSSVRDQLSADYDAYVDRKVKQHQHGNIVG